MKIKSFFVALSYIRFYSLPKLTINKPGDCDSIEVKIINISASEIAKTLDGKYFIIGSDIAFHDTHGMMENIDSVYVHLVLTTYHKIDDISDCGINPQAEVIHAGMVDAEHSSEFKKNREITSDGEGFRLFMEYVRALNESECKYFLYENNYSIHQNIKDEISKRLGVEPIMINSALVSAQNRKRCYWTNIPVTSFPADKGIMLKDVLKSGVAWQDKSYCMTARYSGAIDQHCFIASFL